MSLPVALASMVNTLRTDVDDTAARIQHQVAEAARLRVADDRTTHDILDELKSKVAARFLHWFESGQMAEALLAIGQDAVVHKAPSSSIQFPTGT